MIADSSSGKGIHSRSSSMKALPTAKIKELTQYMYFVA